MVSSSTCNSEVRLDFRWPAPAPDYLAENVFFGAWHTTQAIRPYIQPTGRPEIEVITGRNWFLASSVSPLHATNRSLLRTTDSRDFAVAFRGYVVEPPIHAHSPSEAILSYWSTQSERRHNGVFSACTIDTRRGSISLWTDAFGLGPLYYRVWNGILLFASNPRFLAIDGDVPDYVAWRTLIQTGFIASDRSLNEDIKRVPAGYAITWSGASLEHRQWFVLEQLPNGSRRVDDAAIRDVEDKFQAAMSRCLQLDLGSITLPLSSGHDSRRILASLIDRQLEFEAITARFRQKGFRDLDATYAAAMAEDFAFRHTIVEPGTPERYAEYDEARRTLLDNESFMHAWAIGLMKSLPNRPSVLFDGLLGDILGNPGFRMPGMYQSTRQDLELILRECVTGHFDPYLAADRWPCSNDVAFDIEAYLAPFMGRINMAEFAFILLRQRRLTSGWSQQLAPAGHIVACPYADLDYITLLFELSPEDKHATVLQRECLRRFWPEMFKYPGNRDVPADMPPGKPVLETRQTLASARNVLSEIEELGAHHQLADLLSNRARAALILSRFNGVLLRAGWFLQPVAELVARQVRRNTCWSVTAASEPSGHCATSEGAA